MERILVLNGSPKGENGNTAVLINRFLEGYQEVNKDVQIDRITLKNETINRCTGCYTCWTKTPGKCVFGDDMTSLLEKYLSADVVVWATPLYHYGMTSILKTFVERTLPLSQPYIVENNGKFSHPSRWGEKRHKNVLISNCGFPEHHNFEVMRQSFDRVVHGKVDAEILCVMGELLSVKPLKGKIAWYLDAVKKAGNDFATSSVITQSTIATLSNPLVPVESFIEMANLNWQATGETPPDLASAMGRTADNASVDHKEQCLPGYSYLKLMAMTFNPENAKDMSAVLEMSFTDIEESHQFHIKDGTCDLVRSQPLPYTTRIVTTFKVWQEIADGTVDGAQAMIDGLYRVEGDINFMMKMGDLFGSGEENTSDDTEGRREAILGIPGNKWMGILFIPWMLSWIGIGMNTFVGIWLPLVLTAGVIILKRKHNQLTHFEKMSGVYFALLATMTLVGIPVVGRSGIYLNYFAIALIWGSSLLSEDVVTAEYSKFEFDGDPSNVLFIKTNVHLTLFWTFIFTLQGVLAMGLDYMNLFQFAPLLYLLTIGALRVTLWYSRWYPENVMRGV